LYTYIKPTMSALEALKAKLEHARAGLHLSTAHPAYEEKQAASYLATITRLHVLIAEEEKKERDGRTPGDSTLLTRLETSEIRRGKQQELEEDMVAWFIPFFNNVILTGDKSTSTFDDDYAGKGASIYARPCDDCILLEELYARHLFPTFQKCVVPLLLEAGHACVVQSGGAELLIPLDVSSTK
jgi:hypothetical protein